MMKGDREGTHPMSDEQFLTIPSIPGEVKDDRHPGSIEVLNWSWLVSHATSGAAGGGGRVGRAELSDIMVVLRFDSATPRLFDACARGKRFAEVLLSVRRNGMIGDYLTLRLTDAAVTSVSTAHSGDYPVVQISLGFASVTMTHQIQQPDGSLGDPITVTLGEQQV
jgi:type VI secretion system secreted protein Hcp